VVNDMIDEDGEEDYCLIVRATVGPVVGLNNQELDI